MHAASSGDLLADRRYEYARAYFEAGDHAAATDLYLQALELVPGWLPALVGAADALAAAGRRAEAEPLLRQAAARDTDGLFGTSLKLAALGLAEVPVAPPEAYVRGLFDDYADRFETALVNDLGYRAPWLIADLIDRVRPRVRFARGADLGCGTGLMAEVLKGRVEHFAGCDLSPEMVTRADVGERYQALAVADAASFLSMAEGNYHLITAADVLVYVGGLDALFRAVAARLAPDGLFAFTVEEADDGDLVLRDSLRYAHSEAYIRRGLSEVGLVITELARDTLRFDRGAPIRGLIAVAERAP
ncbi:class I SAM-dependent DNA methyltransferase [Pleomorphomonas oryzae]|uniref:class I SAM-dependent DNA methyltransferase n=1 Tax=Pleomorphomonas oryzae TaxID=261934 RepID=UPI00040C3DEA|nr:methyltransferase domain-containing protein [Pleomorphomonas oryzae]